MAPRPRSRTRRYSSNSSGGLQADSITCRGGCHSPCRGGRRCHAHQAWAEVSWATSPDTTECWLTRCGRRERRPVRLAVAHEHRVLSVEALVPASVTEHGELAVVQRV